MRCGILIIIFLAHVAAVAQAQGPVSMDVSARRVSMNEVFHISITANGSEISEPDMQDVIDAGIRLDTPSHRSSTSIQTIGGETAVTQSRTWRYPASISQEGMVTIPRISVTVDGQEYFTQPKEIEVTRTVDMGARPPDDTAELTIEDLAFIRAATDKRVVYNGEPLLLRLRLYVLDQFYVSLETPRRMPMPETHGFQTGQQWQESYSEMYAGRRYRVTELSQVLYPTTSGDLTVGAWEWQGGVRWFNSRRQPQTAARVFETNPVQITVLPLPTPRPSGFSGAVGRFDVDARLNAEHLTQGAPVRFNITISGEGNPNAISAPSLPEMPWAHFSDPEVETQQQQNSTEVQKHFSYLLTPLRAGLQEIPPVQFLYFSPESKEYVTAYGPAIPVEIQPASDSDTFVAIGGSAEEQRRRIEVYDDGLLPIITDPQVVFSVSTRPGRRLGFLTMFSPVVTLALLIATVFTLKHRRRLLRDTGYARRYYAKSTCIKRLDAATAAEDPTDSLYRALTGFIGDMLNINEAGLTSSEVEAVLSEAQVPEALRSVVVRSLKACERARYAGRGTSKEEAMALCSAVRDAVEQLHELLWEKQS